jgi:hypothetical protein
MDPEHFDSLTRVFDVRWRRRLLNTLSAAAVAFAPLTVLVDAEAKKRKNKKKKKKRSQNCAASCPSDCEYCLIRPGATTICGTGFSSDCIPCSSDTDCLADPPVFPYCVSQVVKRATGVPEGFCEPVVSYCSKTAPCA